MAKKTIAFLACLYVLVKVGTFLLGDPSKSLRWLPVVTALFLLFHAYQADRFWELGYAAVAAVVVPAVLAAVAVVGVDLDLGGVGANEGFVVLAVALVSFYAAAVRWGSALPRSLS